MTGTAVISPDGVYRYILTRTLPGGGPPLLLIMLNPSKATADVNDPTITRIVGFGNRENAAWVGVVNAHALRATDPAELRRHRSPIGPDNDASILKMAERVRYDGGKIIAAWGAHPFARDRVRYITRELLRGFQLYCLGTTKDGSPRHPLYVRGDQPLMEYAP